MIRSARALCEKHPIERVTPPLRHLPAALNSNFQLAPWELRMPFDRARQTVVLVELAFAQFGGQTHTEAPFLFVQPS